MSRRRMLVLIPAVLATVAAACSTSRSTAPPTYPDTSQTTYPVHVLVLAYFPVTGAGPEQQIDRSVTGTADPPVGDGSLAAMRRHVSSITANLKAELSEGTAYHGYRDSAAAPSIIYDDVASIEHLEAVPTEPNPHYGSGDPYRVRADYDQLMRRENICDYVDNKGVTQVWLWAYQGATELGISESAMSGPHGDISNSTRDNAMPVCSRTYRVYTFNQFRSTAEAVHSYGHQVESELSYFDPNLFGNLFEGVGNPHPGNDGGTARCGSVHNPPNARNEYDWANPAAQLTDCVDWQPDGGGSTTSVSCQTWGCQDNGDDDNPQLNWIIWWMQSIPGVGNRLAYQGSALSNWWSVDADFDTAWRRQASGQNPLLTTRSVG